MGFTLGHRLMHLPHSQWVEVYDAAGRDIGLHRDVEGLLKVSLSQALDLQLQLSSPSPSMSTWLEEQSDDFKALAHKLQQHQEQVAAQKGVDPKSLHFTWRKENTRYKLTLS